MNKQAQQTKKKEREMENWHFYSHKNELFLSYSKKAVNITRSKHKAL